MTTRTTALVYVRVSRLDEDERARKVSPEMQREKSLALNEVAGLATEVFEDLDISGKDTAHRPQYLAMMRRLESDDVRYVVAYDQSRVTRDLGDLQHFRRALAEHGAQFIEASTGRLTDPHDEDQELSSNVLGSVDQHYRKKVQRRVRDALASKVAHGEMVGPVPAGYVRRRELTPDGTKVARLVVEFDAEKAPIIRLLFAEYATGFYSFKSLAIEFNRRGTPLARPASFHNGRPAAQLWTADVIKDLIGNPRYVGRVPRRDGRVFDATYPALIEADTWTACERNRLRGRPTPMMGTRRRSPYLLSGVLRCALCDSTMSGERRPADKTHQPRYSYTCYRRRVARACDLPYLPQAKLEDEILGVLRAIAVPDGLAEAIDAAVAAHVGADGRRGKATTLRQLRERQTRLNEIYELGRLGKDDYLKRSAELDEQVASASVKRAQPLFVRQRTMVQSLVDKWASMTTDERKQLIALIFEVITADGDGIARLLPREEWKPYMRAVVPAEGGTERKTGLARVHLPFHMTLRRDDSIVLRRAA